MARRKTKKKKLADLPAQPDPTAPLDGAVLLSAAQGVLKELRTDLLARAKGSAAVTRALKARHVAEKKAERTADGFVQWQNRFVGQVAAAWLLSCVFVRTLEDRQLLERNRLAGPGAADAQRQFFDLAPSLTERDYLLTIFKELCRYPAAADLFDARHNPVWLLAPSAAAAKRLLALFRTPSAEEPAFRFGQESTRFLGDLYQDLDEDVRKRYALLQTPDFVEQFILDRTLDPAIEKFGLGETTLIDPTCGSGHFLLGAYDRLFDRRLREQPGLDARQTAHVALNQVYGADINPYAVAIARFRLTLSFLTKAAYAKLGQAPRLPLHVAVADSLLYNPQHTQTALFHQEGVDATQWDERAFDLEDQQAARDVLHREYAAVVGNPPYITVKDKILRGRYRDMYVSAAMQYSLGAPFTERFFQLARQGARVGIITANSFMKREFGKKLIQEYLPTVNIDLIVNTSGAYIPGHGTPTVLLFGTHEPALGQKLLAVLAKRGEPATPANPAKGAVWSSIAEHWNQVDFENDYISVTHLWRKQLASHPWSLAGGGAAELKQALEERAALRLGDLVDLIGFGAVTREDDVFVMPKGLGTRWSVPSKHLLQYGFGECVRDWSVTHSQDIIFPYTLEGTTELTQLGRWAQVLWRYRTQLWLRQGKGFKTKRESGGEYYEYSMYYPSRQFAPLKLTFAFVATHNHFVLDRGNKVFNRSAPIIRLSEGASEEDHLALLAYLNSSTACFWMKQVFFPKYGALKADHPDPARNFYEFAGTGMQELPCPDYGNSIEILRNLARELSEIGTRRTELLSLSRLADEILCADSKDPIQSAWHEADRLRRRAIALQEEIDWLTYTAFGLCEHSLVDSTPEHLQSIRLTRGQRAFETEQGRLSLVRSKGMLLSALEAEVETEAPTILFPRQQELRERRRNALLNNKKLQLIESNVFKRLWRDTESNETESRFRIAHREAVAKEALYKLTEAKAQETGTVCSSVILLSDTHTVVQTFQLDASATLKEESVPFLAAFRFKEAGLEKHTAWQHTWSLQRREDEGEEVGDIPVPPKYTSKDFRKPHYYKLRGKLDVPKERFISYPDCESDEDGEPVYGWAGWDHEQRAKALATLYWNRKTQEGWEKERLLPMLAGLEELMFWLEMWHGEPHDEYAGESPAKYYRAFLEGECQLHGFTHKDLLAWRPAPKRRGRKRK